MIITSVGSFKEEYALKDLSTTFTNVTECSVDNSITEEGVGIPEGPCTCNGYQRRCCLTFATVYTSVGGTNRCSSYRETNLKEKLRYTSCKNTKWR